MVVLAQTTVTYIKVVLLAELGNLCPFRKVAQKDKGAVVCQTVLRTSQELVQS